MLGSAREEENRMAEEELLQMDICSSRWISAVLQLYVEFPRELRIVTYFYVYFYVLNVLSAPPSRFSTRMNGAE